MKSDDKKLLLRVALRMERLAKERFDAAPPDRKEEAKRTRDHELGDVLDLRDYADRMDRAGQFIDRNAVLEEAAVVCDGDAEAWTLLAGSNAGGHCDGVQAQGAQSCAEKIRALKAPA